MRPTVSVSAEDPYSPEAEALMADLSARLTEITGASGRNSFRTEDVCGSRAVFAVARDETGAAVGCGAFRPMNEAAAEIKRMYAAKPSLGIGTALLSFLEAKAQKMGYTALRLETRSANTDAVSFYERHGYDKISNYGKYETLPGAVCFEKQLAKKAPKRLIFVNGTMGAGKTATCRELFSLLKPCVFLDGDWCWNMNPFTVTEETKQMVLRNITALLQNFLLCSEYETVIFCWVMHEEGIMDSILTSLSGLEYRLYKFTLILSEESLRRRVLKDVADGVRTADMLERSIPRLALYRNMNTVKIDVSSITAQQAAEQIVKKLNTI